jgi:hypothetical protein
MSNVIELQGPRLPQEIIDLILRNFRNLDDDPFLWVICRQVSRAMRKEVEFIFRESLLKETVIQSISSIGSHFVGRRFHCRFTEAPPENNLAFFAGESTTQDTRLSSLRGPHESWHPDGPRDVDKIQALVDRYVDVQLWRRGGGLPPFIARIGTQRNYTMLSDVTIPGLTFHRLRGEISVDWVDLYSRFFGEEYATAKLKAQSNITIPDVVPLPTVRPFIADRDHIELVAYRDQGISEQRRQARMPRFRWYLNGEPWAGFDKMFNHRHISMKGLEGATRLKDLFTTLDLEVGEYRGVVCWVEDPQGRGWRQWTVRQDPDLVGRWYNHAWEDPADGGRTTFLEEIEVVEAERMARAWEKGRA